MSIGHYNSKLMEVKGVGSLLSIIDKLKNLEKYIDDLNLDKITITRSDIKSFADLDFTNRFNTFSSILKSNNLTNLPSDIENIISQYSAFSRQEIIDTDFNSTELKSTWYNGVITSYSRCTDYDYYTNEKDFYISSSTNGNFGIESGKIELDFKRIYNDIVLTCIMKARPIIS